MPPRDDVAVRDLAGDAAIAAALAEGFGQPTIVLVDDDASESARALVRAGARAVLARDASGADLDAIAAIVARGYVVLGTNVIAPRDADGADALTPREAEVLDMLARGLGNRKIAERLAISESTVKFHVGSILAKLGATTRTEAVTIGARRGLVML